jgi:hypothetical protein
VLLWATWRVEWSLGIGAEMFVLVEVRGVVGVDGSAEVDGDVG